MLGLLLPETGFMSGNVLTDGFNSSMKDQPRSLKSSSSGSRSGRPFRAHKDNITKFICLSSFAASWLATQHKREQASERTTRGLLAFSNGAKPIKEGRKEASEVENESYKNILALPSTISNGFPKKRRKKPAHSTRSLLWNRPSRKASPPQFAKKESFTNSIPWQKQLDLSTGRDSYCFFSFSVVVVIYNFSSPATSCFCGGYCGWFLV